MNNLFITETKKGNFKSTLDKSPRYAEVNKIQIYEKPKKKNKKNIRCNCKHEYELKGFEIPGLHKTAPQVFDGKIKTNYSQKQVFQIPGDNTKPPKQKEIRFTYTRDNKKLHKYG